MVKWLLLLELLLGGGVIFSLQKLQVCFFLGNLEFNKWDFKLDYLKLIEKADCFIRLFICY